MKLCLGCSLQLIRKVLSIRSDMQMVNFSIQTLRKRNAVWTFLPCHTLMKSSDYLRNTSYLMTSSQRWLMILSIASQHCQLGRIIFLSWNLPRCQRHRELTIAKSRNSAAQAGAMGSRSVFFPTVSRVGAGLNPR